MTNVKAQIPNECQMTNAKTQQFLNAGLYSLIIVHRSLFIYPERPVVRAIFHNRHRRNVHHLLLFEILGFWILFDIWILSFACPAIACPLLADWRRRKLCFIIR